MSPEEKEHIKLIDSTSETDLDEKSTQEEIKRTREKSVEKISEHIMKIHDETFKKFAATKWVKK